MPTRPLSTSAESTPCRKLPVEGTCRMKINSTRRLSLSAVLIAVMLVLGYIESLIPVGSVPGIKLGLSNSVLLLGLLWLGIPNTVALMLCKVVLSGFLFNGFSAMLFSLAGGAVSLAVMCLLYKMKFGTVITGTSGAVFHNVGQVGLAMVILKTDKLVYYMARLMLVGLFTGMSTGSAAALLDKRVSKIRSGK